MLLYIETMCLLELQCFIIICLQYDFILGFLFVMMKLGVVNFDVEVWCFFLSPCVILEQAIQKVKRRAESEDWRAENLEFVG